MHLHKPAWLEARRKGCDGFEFVFPCTFVQSYGWLSAIIGILVSSRYVTKSSLNLINNPEILQNIQYTILINLRTRNRTNLLKKIILAFKKATLLTINCVKHYFQI